MKKLITACLLLSAVSLTAPVAAQIPPPVFIGDPPPANQTQPGQPGSPADLKPGADPLAAARAYFAEKSWQLVAQTADQATTSSLSDDARRELSYLHARALTELHQQDRADKILKQLISENPHDVWAGRAHWRLQPGLEGGRWNIDEKDPLNQLRQADRILTDLKPDDLDDFYMSVINSNLSVRRYDDEKDRNYILSFYDKAVPLLAGNDELIAGVMLRRELTLDAQRDRTDEDRLAGWRGIVSQYPKTRAAAQAQWNVAQYYLARRDYTPALYELTLLTNQFPGTDEAKNAAAEIKKIKRPEAYFQLTGQFLPGEDIKFDLAARNTDSVKLTARPFSIIDELKRQKTARLDLAKVEARATLNEKISIDRADNYRTTTRTVELKIDNPGAYVLTAEVDGRAVCNGLLIISNLALVGNTGNEKYEFWAVDAKSGKPRQGVKITVGHDLKSEQQWLTGKNISYFAAFDEVRTGTDGFADFAPARDESSQVLAVATDGKNVALLDGIYWSRYAPSRGDRTMVYAYTDRPVYRPEQKVYWRGVVRDQEAGNYQLPSGTYTVEIRDSQGQEIWRQADMKLSEFGTLAGELDLPAGAPLGVYNISFREQQNNRHIGNGTFRVEEYKKPEFLVSVESASDFAKIGQNVKARVEANYLFGSPVTDATVKYTVRRRPRYRIMWENISWHLGDRDLGWFEEKPDRPPVLHGSDGVIVAEGTGKLNDKGEFELQFDSTVPDDELKNTQPGPTPMPWFRMIWPPRQPAAWDFQVEVTVTDASRRNIDASQVIPVGVKALSLAAKTDRNLVTPGDNARVELKSYNLAEKPVPTSGTLYIEKLEYNEKAKQDDITTVSTQQVTIGSSGSLILNWRVPSDLHGRLRFAYIVDDPFGGKSVAYANFVSAGPDDKDLAVQYQGVEIVADKNQYEVGDTARIMILSEHRDAQAWFWIDAGSGSLEKKVLPLPHRTNFLSLPITEAYVPNSKIHIVAVRDKHVILDEFELIVPPTRKIVNVQVIPAADKVEPGQPSRVTIRATDVNGAPVSAEFSLSIFDKAITYIAPDMREDIRRFFYGTRRPLRSQIQQSLDSASGYGGSLIEDIMAYLDFQPPGVYRALGTSLPSRRAMYADASLERKAGAAPALAAAPAAMAMEAGFAGQDVAQQKSAAAAPPPEEQPAIRADFRDSMFWSPTVRTDASGSATVDIKYPDSLTTWQLDAVGLTADTRVGNATTDTVARKKVLVRLQAPRFFRERDEVIISGNIHNYTDTNATMKATLQSFGVDLENGTTATHELKKAGTPIGSVAVQENSQTVQVPAGGEARVDWKVRVNNGGPGNAMLILTATSPAGGDAMQAEVPVLPHGIDKFVAWNGTSEDANTTGADTRTSGTGKVITRTVTLPAERIRATSRLEINVNPSLAYSIREALPYMIDYPYGCVEQTMSRFMPAVVASRAFEKLGYPADKALTEKLPVVTADSLKRLHDMQLPTGGWGWWASDSENIYMTSYVMYGLTLARQAGVTVDGAMYTRGLDRLKALRDDLTSVSENRDYKPRFPYYYFGGSGLHNLAYAEYVLTLNGASSSRTLELVWTKRDDLGAHGLAMLARTLGMAGRTADADVALRNMLNMAVITPENNTMRWGKPESGWLWYNDAVEATAVGLMAYLDLHPDDPAVDRAMKWLVLNRQGSQWKSTRDTAQAVLALTQYMLQKKEAATDATIRVSVAGKPIRELKVTPAIFWDFDGKIELRGNDIPDGDFPVQIEVESNSKIYYSIYAEYFTLEEGIKAAGNEIYVMRSYEKLRREQTTETVNGAASVIYKDTWIPLKDGDPLASGDEVRVNLKLKSLNDYEYLVFEDPKPAGMEAVDLQSGGGWRYGTGLCSNVELRDAWTAFFISHLTQGEHEITYRLRAEIPGTFHAMPTTGYAMYFPILRTNADEKVITIKD